MFAEMTTTRMIGTKRSKRPRLEYDLDGSGRGEGKAASMESKNRDRGEGLDGRIEDIEANRRQDDKAKTGMG
jgi:hypothetical protein